MTRRRWLLLALVLAACAPSPDDDDDDPPAAEEASALVDRGSIIVRQPLQYLNLTVDAVEPAFPHPGEPLTIRYHLVNFRNRVANGTVDATLAGHAFTPASASENIAPFSTGYGTLTLARWVPAGEYHFRVTYREDPSCHWIPRPWGGGATWFCTYATETYADVALTIQPPCPAPEPTLAYDQVQQRSIHNAYLTKVHEGLFDQLVYHRVRNFEWDIHSTSPWTSATPDGNDWFMYHTAVAGEYGRCDKLSDCLRLLRAFHDAVPRHEVVTVNLEFKGWGDGNAASVFPDCCGDASRQSPDGLDARLRAELGNALYTPADLLASCPGAPDLLTAVTTCGWPSVDRLRGKVIVVTHAWTWVLNEVRNPNPGVYALLQEYAGGSNAVASRRAAFVAPLSLTDNGDWEAQLLARPWIVFHTEVGSRERAAEVRRRFPGVVFRSGDRATPADFADAQAQHNFVLTDHVSWHETPWARTHNAYGYPFCPLFVTGAACWQSNHRLAEKRERQHLVALDVRSGDIQNSRDSFAFSYVFAPTAQAGSWSGFVSGASSGPIHHWAKGCVMLRASLAADAPYYAVCRAGDDEELFIQYRSPGCSGACGTAHDEASLGHGIQGEDAVFVKLDFVPIAGGGVRVQGYGSSNGRDYQPIGPAVSFPIDLPYQGIAASSNVPDASNADGTATRWLFGNLVRSGVRYTTGWWTGTERLSAPERIGDATLAQATDLSWFDPPPPLGCPVLP